MTPIQFMVHQMLRANPKPDAQGHMLPYEKEQILDLVRYGFSRHEIQRMTGRSRNSIHALVQRQLN